MSGQAYLDRLAARVRDASAKLGWNVTQDYDWNDQYKIPAVLALIHSEVSEALEEFRVDNKEKFLVEMADVQIRLLDLVGALTDNFDQIVENKIWFNAQREYRHGNKRL